MSAGLSHRAYLVHVWSNQVVQFVENAVNNFNQQMALLVLQGGRHEQRQDLVEQGACSELTSLICDLTQGGLRQERRGSLSQAVDIPKTETAFSLVMVYTTISTDIGNHVRAQSEDITATNLSHGRCSIFNLQ